MKLIRMSILVGTSVIALAGCGGNTASPSSAAQPSREPTASTSASPTSPAGGLPQGSDPVTLDPTSFVAEITHPYWPMPVGARWTYSEVDADGTEFKVVVDVRDETKEILGIATTVVHDQVTQDGEIVEDTTDWYAQDADGNLWYMGEDTAEYENGEIVSTEGSWEAGVDGAQPGIILPAVPEVGQAYRQEYLEGQAEDEAIIVSISDRVVSDAGEYENAIATRESTPLEPAVLEYKWYAPGVGIVEALGISPDFSREQLTHVDGL